MRGNAQLPALGIVNSRLKSCRGCARMGEFMRYLRRVAVLVAGIGAACSDATFTVDTAARVLERMESFRRPAHFRIETEVPLQSAFRCQTRAEVERRPLLQFAAQRGWVRYESRDARVGFGARASCPAVALTPAGEAASRLWTKGRTTQGNGASWAVPVGERKLLRVGEVVTTSEGLARVVFEWRWAPNETGTALRASFPKAQAFFDQQRTGRATCRFEEEWRCQLGMWTTPVDAGELAL